MSFYVFTDSGGLHYRHVDKPVSVTVLDANFQPMGPTIVARLCVTEDAPMGPSGPIDRRSIVAASAELCRTAREVIAKTRGIVARSREVVAEARRIRRRKGSGPGTPTPY